MTWLLITNDDGVDSPALVPLVQALTGMRQPISGRMTRRCLRWRKKRKRKRSRDDNT